MRTAVFATIFLALAVMIPIILISLSGGAVDFRGLGIVFIGPFPIFFDVTDPRSAVFLLVPVLVFLLGIFYAYARTRKITVQRE